MQFVQFCWIDVYVDYFGMWCEGIEFIGYVIVKVCVDGDQQIVFLYCQVGCFSVVYFQYVEIIGIISIYYVQFFQGVGCWYSGYCQEFV